MGSSQMRLDDDFRATPRGKRDSTRELDATVRAFRRWPTQIETISDRMAQVELTERRLQLLGECRGVLRRLESATDALNAVAASGRWAPARCAVDGAHRAEGAGAATLRRATRSRAPPARSPVRPARDGCTHQCHTCHGWGFHLPGVTDRTVGERFTCDGAGGLPVAVRLRRALPPRPADDVPDPREDEAGHDAAIADVVRDLAWAGDGGLFVLFTSHAALRRAAVTIRAELGHRFPVLVQGETQRDLLVRRFREAGNAILLGTDSFWEGVDVPGRALKGLVLAKLPFKVPSEPLTAAGWSGWRSRERMVSRGICCRMPPSSSSRASAADPRGDRRRRGGVARSAGDDQAVWRDAPGGAAAGRARGGIVGAGAHALRRLLCPTRD
jgi:hypothetical protein